MPLNIAIIGSSIAGPSAAISLALKSPSYHIKLFERLSPSSTSVGHAFRITDNATLALQHIGIDIHAGGAVSSNSQMSFGEEGKLLIERMEDIGTFAERGALAGQLRERARSVGVQVFYGRKVLDIRPEEGVILFEDGASEQADLIVGADGIHSVVRSKLFPGAEPVGAKFDVVRFMLRTEDLQKDGLLKELFTGPGSTERMLGWGQPSSGRTMIMYPVDFGRQWAVACGQREDLTPKSADEDTAGEAEKVAYNAKIGLEDLLKIFKNYEPRVRRLFELADPNGFRIWKLRDLDEMRSWRREKAVLVGDAAHANLPFAFAGAGMAIEDGVSLAEFLGRDCTVEETESRLKMWEEFRRARTSRVQMHARNTGRGKKVSMEERTEYLRWLSRYDVIDEARKAVARQ